MHRNTLKDLWMDVALAGATVVALAGAASAEDCRPVIVKEGYLSQAQFECDFADLGEALQDASRKCGDKLGKDAVGEALKEGMTAAIAEVQAEVRKAGDSAAWCEDIVKRYPDDVVK
jgi:hypothetical protein